MRIFVFSIKKIHVTHFRALLRLTQFKTLAEKVATQDFDKIYEKLSQTFIQDKASLIKAWQKNDIMPGSSHVFAREDAKAILENSTTRDRFIGMVNLLDKTSQNQGLSHGKSQNQHQEDEEWSRGGRSR